MRRRELRKRRRAGKQRRKVEVDREGEAMVRRQIHIRRSMRGSGMELVQGEERGRKRK